MPYTVKKVKGGYKACKKNSTKCFSKKPLKSKKKAAAQIGAIESSEKKQTKNESFDQIVNNLLNSYLFEGEKKKYSDEDEEVQVSDQEVSKEINNIKKKKQQETASINPAEVKKIMQGAKKIGVNIGGNTPQ